MRTQSSPAISLCMIVKNEERWLARCLESAKGVVSEIVIVDTGSVDRTVQIASSFGAVLVSRKWEDDFAAARNAGLEHATGEWILVLDADEELETDTRERIRKVAATTTADGLLMCQRSLMPAQALDKHQDLWINRLFRNRPEYRYEQAIHEQISPSIRRCGGTVAKSDLIILHYGFAEGKVQGGGSRAERNIRVLAKAISSSPTDPYLHYQAGATYKALGKSELAYALLRRATELGTESLGQETVDRLYMKLAQLALASNELPEALQYARRSLERNPGNVVSMYVLALANMFNGKVKEAQPVLLKLRKSPELNPAAIDQLDTVIAYCQANSR